MTRGVAVISCKVATLFGGEWDRQWPFSPSPVTFSASGAEDSGILWRVDVMTVITSKNAQKYFVLSLVWSVSYVCKESFTCISVCTTACLELPGRIKYFKMNKVNQSNRKSSYGSNVASLFYGTYGIAALWDWWELHVWFFSEVFLLQPWLSTDSLVRHLNGWMVRLIKHKETTEDFECQCPCMLVFAVNRQACMFSVSMRASLS